LYLETNIATPTRTTTNATDVAIAVFLICCGVLGEPDKEGNNEVLGLS
jgi:hypothetical protein